MRDWIVRGGLVLAGWAVLGAPRVSGASALSRWVDFDGTGFGSFHSSGPAPICTTCGSNPVGLPARSTATLEARQMQQFADTRLEDQRREAARRAEERRLLEEKWRLEEERQRERERNIENARTIGRLLDIQSALDRLSTHDPRDQYNLKVKLVEAAKALDGEQRRAAARDSSLLRRLAASIARIDVPPPPIRKYQSVLFLGWFTKADDAIAAEVLDRQNPFTGRRYDRVFSFGTGNFITELGRAPLDHFLGDFSNLSEASLARLGDLKDATVEEVVAHSNGAKIAEVLISRGIIRGVKRLRILGGDAALMNIDRLVSLADEKNIALSVYAVQGDPVPLVPVGWQIAEWAPGLLGPPFPQRDVTPSLLREIVGLRRSRIAASARVEVHLLSYPASANPVEKHIYGTYHRIIHGRRLQGCLDPAGELSRKCRIL